MIQCEVVAMGGVGGRVYGNGVRGLGVGGGS